jgi:hypothetical protein
MGIANGLYPPLRTLPPVRGRVHLGRYRTTFPMTGIVKKRPLIVGLRVVTTSLLGVYTGTGSEVVGGPVRRSSSSTEGALVVVVVVVVPRLTPYGLNKSVLSNAAKTKSMR